MYPDKAMLASSEALQSQGTRQIRIELKGELVPNLAKISERKNKVVSTQVKGIRGLFKKLGRDPDRRQGCPDLAGEIEVRTKRREHSESGS